MILGLAIILLGLASMFAQTPGQQDTANIAVFALAPTPITGAVAGITYLCRHTECKPATPE